MNKKLLISLTLFIGCSSDPIEPFHHELDKAVLDKMLEYNIPGLSLAVVKDEKLVYLNSYGFAIKESQVTASNNNLYRLASISKVVTAVSVLKLVADGLISLDQPVFGTEGVLGVDFGVPPIESMKDQITIRHLIEHKSGWTNSPDDPVFTANEHTQAELIQNLVTERPLSYIPGTTYFYSNIGYVILGRLIEKISGEAYEDYVLSNILNPIGITQMKIGGSTLEERFENEVRYYSQRYNEGAPYVMAISRMDATAGWIASATDLARLLVRIDKGSSRADIIPQQILNQFYFEYAWSHSGTLPGNSGFVARLNSSLTVVFLTNSDHADAYELFEAFKQEVLEIKKWPDIDLF